MSASNILGVIFSFAMLTFLVYNLLKLLRSKRDFYLQIIKKNIEIFQNL